MAVLLEYKCPSCGGALSFDSDVQKLKCPYCDTTLEVSALQELDDALKQEQPEDTTWSTEPSAQWNQEEQAQLHSFVCESCGGEITTEATTAATHCPYCDNPVVVAKQLSGQFKPDLVVPFKLDKAAAMEALKKHMKGKPLLPKAFTAENRIERVQGVYVPFWLFDTQVDANIRYRATKVRTWSDSNYIYTRTSHFSLLRGGCMDFANVPVDGSVKLDNALMESIEPYDMSQAVDFQTAYLAGYLADKFDVSADDCKTRANERIRSSVESYFASTTAGYASVIPENTNLRYSGSKVRYALLPVWLLTTRYKDKTYTFAMNGQTGKLVGNLPIHWGSFFKYLFGIGLGGGFLISLLAWLFISL